MMFDKATISTDTLWKFVESIVENIPQMVLLKDAAQLRFVLINRAAEEILGRDRAELIGKRDHDVFRRAEADAFVTCDREVLATKTAREIAEEVVHTRHRGVRILHTRAIPLVAVQASYLLRICEDTTETRRAAQVLTEETAYGELLRTIAVASNQASRVDEALKTAIDEVCRHTRWPVGHAYRLNEATGRLDPSDLWHLDDPERFAQFRRVTEQTHFTAGMGLPGRVLASGRAAWIVDVDHDPNFPRAKLATELGVRAGFAFPVLVGQQVAAVLEFFADEPKDPDERLLLVMSNIGTQLGRVIERERTQVWQSLLVGIVGHDLRTPLTALTLTVQHLRLAKELPVALGKMVGQLESYTRRMRRLINDLLDYTQSRARGGIPIVPVLADIDEICRHALGELTALNPNREVRYEPGDDGLGTWDGERIEQVLKNLLGNALKYGVANSAVRLRWWSSPDSVTLEVANEGSPIPAELIPFVFEPLWRGSTRAQGAERSVGLGLFIVREIVRAHGGAVSVRSDSAGTIFTVELPRHALRAWGHNEAHPHT